MIIVPLS